MDNYKRKLTQEDRETIIRLAKMGTGFSTIVEYLDGKVSRQRVHQICIKAGIDPMAVTREIRELERQDRMRRLYGSFWHDNKLAADKKVITAARNKFKNKKRSSTHLFNIEFEDIEWPTHCPVLGIELDYFARGRRENSVSFDRVDNTKPYEKGNVVIMSWRANRLKNDGTAEEHRLISNFMHSKGVK